MTEKLDGIAALTDGWWGEGSKAVAPYAIALAREAVAVMSKSPVHVATGPTAEGVLLLEWSAGDWQYTAELCPDGQLITTRDCEALDVYVEVPGKATTSALLGFFSTSVEA